MGLVDLASFAATQLRRNPGRTALTTVGVAVGVFALTTIVAIGRGLEVAVTEQLTDDESQTRIVLRPGFGPLPQEDRPAVEGVTDPAKADRLRKAIAKRRRGGPAQQRRTLLTPASIAALRTSAHVTAARPFVIDRFALTVEGHATEGALSYGVEPSDRRWAARVIAGAPFTPDAQGVWLHEYLLYAWGYRGDAEQAALVGREVVLGRPREATGVAALLDAARRSGVDVPAIDPAMAEPLLRAFANRAGAPGEAQAAPDLALRLPILGVIRERVEADGFEVWEDSFSMQADLFLPQPLAERLFLEVPSNVARGYSAAAIEVDAPGNVAEVEAGLRDAGWGTVSVGSILERVGQVVAMVTVFVSGLTAIALFVAVLGIVNTMIMNVSERTREIGTLKALGATDGQVRGVFLVESALIGALGGLIGVGASVLASWPGDWISHAAILRMTEYAYPGSIFSFPAWLIALALGFALGLSTLAALGPATVASRIDPVVALRDE